ncbi:MAG: hypothetical protein E3K36_15295 [Candidatus Brocadia sp.]|nr:hypothetical protein [Candidatus Brocadia sp.]
MGKNSVLGHDPLGWMKITKENKKSFPTVDVDATIQNTGSSDHQTGSPEMLPQQIPVPMNKQDDRNPDVSKVSQPHGKNDSIKTDNITDNTTTPKPRVVIGRLYEKPSTEKATSAQHNEGTFLKSKPYIETSFPASRTMQPAKRNEPEIKRISRPVSADRFSTYIIITYTALLLILGYFVYNDLSKRTSRIEARLFAIEKALHLK